MRQRELHPPGREHRCDPGLPSEQRHMVHHLRLVVHRCLGVTRPKYERPARGRQGRAALGEKGDKTPAYCRTGWKLYLLAGSPYSGPIPAFCRAASRR